MKLNVVIKVALDDKKSRTKAIKTAVGVDGVTQATLQNEKNQIEVTGEDIDVVLLTTLLRKSLKYAEVVSGSPIDKKKEEEKKNNNEVVGQLIWHPYVTTASYYQMPDPGYVSYHHDQPSSCSLM
ncbi:heavy metal-associated isoprenylated plant protein 16 [Cannabis sativa]|uniref:heavy metal-associated isoprenylated plant protein 16 n=1 Tax=Cannabis sativa TaxID=3483 RepID=UPI0029CA7A24|nr:heavy metal-associated isoprenylated plant protein 16 [Cannabis sativa]